MTIGGRLPDSSHSGVFGDIVKIVDQMLVLNKKYSEINSVLDKASTARLIKRTDRSIDELIYKLYGLTDEEIGIVKDATL